mmetsp:Transcript_3257/g.4700  ORF Transcript_3257/g.4700 Transcript_3257/m.4700 type:complete len:85 (-) Transcript_3257:276-530(-)
MLLIQLNAQNITLSQVCAQYIACNFVQVCTLTEIVIDRIMVTYRKEDCNCANCKFLDHKTAQYKQQTSEHPEFPGGGWNLEDIP